MIWNQSCNVIDHSYSRGDLSEFTSDLNDRARQLSVNEAARKRTKTRCALAVTVVAMTG